MKMLNRRQFIYTGTAFFSVVSNANGLWTFKEEKITTTKANDIAGSIFKNDAPDTLWKWSKEAIYFSRINGNTVICGLCPNRCRLSPGDRSVCRSRVNIGGKLYSLAYGNPCAANVDPVEKKPLFHFLPRTKAFSIATTGCNFRCLNCQNWEISQAKPHEVRHYDLFPEDVVTAAIDSGCASIAYTYSEPTTFFEYMTDTAAKGQAAGLKNLWISNGYINEKPLVALCRVLDGANVNLKSIDDAIYRKLNGGRLNPVLRTFKILDREAVHFEMTHLVVPGYGDEDRLVKQMCRWILDNVGPDHPLHFLRFFPKYKLNRLPPTPIKTLERFRLLAMAEGVHYVYIGNVPGHEGTHTYCHRCKELIIRRQGYDMPVFNLKGDRCGFCNTRIPGVWENNGG